MCFTGHHVLLLSYLWSSVPVGTPYNGLYMYGEALPKRGIFFRLQVYERVGISLVKVYKRLCSSRAWWPVVPNFCSHVTSKS